MERLRKSIRGVDEDAWALLEEVREISRTQTGALVSDAIRTWYSTLPVQPLESGIGTSVDRPDHAALVS